MAKEKKNSIPLNIFVSILALIFGFVVGFAGYGFIDKPTDSDKYISGDLKIHFLELGNIYTGDCVYVQIGETDVLIDAGSLNNSAKAINKYISSHIQDDTIEYVIATHAHEDHLAGFYSQGSTVGVFEKFKIETIIDFPMTNKTNPSATSVLGRYIDARDAEIAEGAKHYTALECYNNTGEAQRIFDLGNGIEMEILYSYYYDHTDSAGENNYSVCMMLHQGDNHFLFTGDLEAEGEEKLVEYYADSANGHDPLPHCVLYKAGHHGSKTSSCEELMEAISPEYVCVCCCAGTAEYTDTTANQFPTQEFINRVAPYTDKIYVTSIVDKYVAKSEWSKNGKVKSMNGNIVFTSNKKGITIECSNNNKILKETAWFTENRTLPSAWQTA